MTPVIKDLPLNDEASGIANLNQYRRGGGGLAIAAMMSFTFVAGFVAGIIVMLIANSLL